MKKFSMLTALAAVVAMLFLLVSCGELEKNESDNELSDEAEITDETVVDEEETVDEAPAELLYPEEVSATCKKAGDVARNLAFLDDKNEERTLSEWYKPNNDSSKLIWLIISTYDCPYCNVEKKDIPKLNGKYEKDGMKTILIMNGLLSGPQTTLEPDKIAKLKDTMMVMEGSAADHTYGYFSSSQQAEFRKFINEGYPVNIFIDANTMKILKHFEGWAEEQEFFDETDKFIESVLEIL
jgi:thioredoxin-related protein